MCGRWDEDFCIVIFWRSLLVVAILRRNRLRWFGHVERKILGEKMHVCS